MPIRYFKCHTLPFPSYDVTCTPRDGVSGIAISWRNGPNGQSEPTQATIEYRLTTDMSTTTAASGVSTVTAAGTVTSYNLDGLSASTQYAIRIRRTNSAGNGDFTPFLLATAGLL